MTTIQIIIAVFSSSLLAAGLTSAVNYYLTTVNYRNEYYKKLLDRRLSAYELVDNYLSQLRVMTENKKENTLVPYLLFKGVAEFEKTTLLLSAPMKRNLWLSNELSFSLHQLNILLLELSNDANKSDDPDKELIRLGSERLEVIREKRDEVESILKRDFQTMHLIEDFVKS